MFMLRIVASIALAATVSLGSATLVSAMQQTGSPPGLERPSNPQAAAPNQMTHGSRMMGQMDDGMMGNPQMNDQMDKMTEDCPCCQRMAQSSDREQQKRP
jgi:hypothetical protein